MGIGFSLIVVLGLILIAYVGVLIGLESFFGIVVPYAAVLIFFLGLIYRIVKWGKAPVPFKIPTTAGQQKSFDWIKSNPLDNPSSTKGVLGRMALEVLLFRSLFRNTKVELREGPKVLYQWEKWLWLAALIFHWSFLVIFIRHLRFFTEPVPFFIEWLESLDSFFQVGLPVLYVTDILIILGVTYLFIRRVIMPNMRYISLPSDYFPLFLIFALAVTGILMRYFIKTDIVGAKEMALGWVTFSPTVVEGLSSLFYIHLFLVCALFIYFPFSKLMHLGGVFLSPTRNLPNDNRVRRHVNPWNYPVKVHTYEEYEEEFREKMKEFGLPVEKE
jgi:nitrate reductase gamma subunit